MRLPDIEAKDRFWPHPVADFVMLGSDGELPVHALRPRDEFAGVRAPSIFRTAGGLSQLNCHDWDRVPSSADRFILNAISHFGFAGIVGSFMIGQYHRPNIIAAKAPLVLGQSSQYQYNSLISRADIGVRPRVSACVLYQAGET